MKRLYCLFLLILPYCLSGQFDDISKAEYLSKTFVSNGDTLQYRIMYPNDFDGVKAFPLLVFLHGMGERGEDNERQLIHGSKLFRDSIDTYPAIVVFPQCKSNDYWANLYRPDEGGASRHYEYYYDKEPNPGIRMVISLMNDLIEKPYIDKDRVYVSGLSMGGHGAFELSWRMQDKVAACIPICGGGPTEKANGFKEIPLWVIHGLKDNVINPRFSINMTEAIQKTGGKAKISLFPEAGHNSWENAFADPDFLSWLFSKRKNQSN